MNGYDNDFIPNAIKRLLENEEQNFTSHWDRGHYVFIFPTKCILWVTPRGGVSWLRRDNFQPQELADYIELRAAVMMRAGKRARHLDRRRRRRQAGR